MGVLTPLQMGRDPLSKEQERRHARLQLREVTLEPAEGVFSAATPLFGGRDSLTRGS